MIRITALNEVENIDNNEECNNALTKEAQEQIALNEYNRALGLLMENNKEEALIVLKELIDTELLNAVRKPDYRDGRSRPMLSLKYSCYKNIAGIEADFKNYHTAIHNYWEAAQLDDSDVMLWYKIGLIAIEIANLEVACLAFNQGLRQNKNHWPCLDHIITVLYAIPDHMNCLYYISMALERDSTYIKGLVFCKEILENVPELRDSITNSKNKWIIDLLSIEYDKVIADSFIKEAVVLQQKWITMSQIEIIKDPSNDLKLRRPLPQLSWLELGKSLTDIYNYIIDNKLNLKCCILFDSCEHLHQSYLINVKKYNTAEIETIKTSKKATCLSNNYDTINFGNHLCSQDDEQVSAIKAEENENHSSMVENTNENFDSKDFEINCFNSQDLDENILIHLNENCSRNIENVKTESSINESGKLNDNLVEHLYENSETSMKYDVKDKAQKVKKRRRSSLCFLTQWAWSSSNTKRSSRARNVGRNNYEKDGLLEQTLRRIFPPAFMAENASLPKEELSKNDDSLDTIDLYYSAADKENNLADGTKSTEDSKTNSPINDASLRYFGLEYETFDVSNFIKMHNGNENIIMLLTKFHEFLCTKWNIEWSDELIELFIQSYLLIRDHLPHFLQIKKNVEDGLLNLDADKTLLFCELYTDKWILKKPSMFPIISSNSLGIGLSSDELGYLIFYSTQTKLNDEKNVIFFLRLLWLQAKIFLYQGEADISIRTLELLLHEMQQLQCNSKKLVIRLRNCRSNSLITVKTVENLLKFIERSQKMRKIKCLYQEKKYEELTYILKDSFNMTKHSNLCLQYGEAPVDRDEQLRILLDSLWQLEQYEECYVWSEACLNESWHSYLNVTSSTKNNETMNKWIRTILYALEKLNACIEEVSISIAKHLSESRRLRLVQNLINLVCHQLEVPDHPTVMIIESVLPWLLLHYILQYEEDKHRAKTENTFKYQQPILMNWESDDEDEDIPSSITILLKAHEFLGRHGWCCINEGKLLIFIMKLLIPQVRSPLYLAIKDKLREPLEQVIYCLYGYPEKNLNSSKLKIKNYDEHVKSHIKLTWEACELLFEFYRPEILPSFESKRVDSINADVVCLFKQICKLVPQDSNPNQILDELNAYLVGKRSDFPCIRNRLQNSQIGYIYYLIADYYFKAVPNQSWKKAITYYKFDLCLHPNELNSWAGLAMSTSTLMETWLNNFQPNINEENYLREAKIAQRSYEQAINLAPSHLTIWTEFGNFLYTVHSFCSRLLKQESDSLNMERFRIIESHKEEMLEEAEKCFTSANRIYIACQSIDEPQDERWLYHYMLAKIAEKKNQEPPIFLSHYSKASQLLNENNAEYPKRISHKCPQNLAIEALEIYYRIHASILKYLEQHEGESIKKSSATIFKEHLEDCSKGPFIMQNTLVSILKIEKSQENTQKHINDVQLRNTRDDKGSNQNTDPATTAFCNEAIKFEGRKRGCESQIYNNVKKMKLSNISHLELMQDVLELTDDLITEVCNNVSRDQYELANEDHEYNAEIMYYSKTIETNRADPFYGASGNSENTYVRESGSRDIQTYLVSKNESVKKGIVKKAQNEISEMRNYFISKASEGLKENDNLTRNISRRGSQESSTTSHTSTTGNNSSSSSSDDSTSSDDTSCSSSTTNSDSDSNISDSEKKKVISDEDLSISSEETAKIIENCLAGLEQCVLRFPEHYKSIYRLAHFFFYNKNYRNINRSKQLLLGTYKCQFHNNRVIQGLFYDRKNNNFFNGIWRIPSNEIDRPGSFASHMSRCILLLMQVLKDTGDSRMLIELCLQLRKTPDTDKKYLGDNERKQLSIQALTLCLQSLRNKIKVDKSIEIFDPHKNQQKQVLLDIFHVYQNVRNMPEFEAELPKIRKLLEDAYSSFSSNFTIHGNIFDMAIEFCRQTIRGCKTKAIGNDVTFNPRIIGASTNQVSLPDVEKHFVPNSQMAGQQRRSQKSVSGGRPRGRPSSLPKFIQTVNNTRMTPNQTESISTISNAYIPLSSNLSDSSSINSFFNQKMLSVMLGSGVNTNMLEYLSQVEKYQNAVKQYQNNLNMNVPCEVNYCKKETNQQLPHQSLGNISTVENCLSSVKDRKDISITPVSLTNSNIKPKSVDLSSHTSIMKPTVSVSVSKSAQKLQFSSSNQTSCPIRLSSLLPITDIQKSLSVHSLSTNNLPSNYGTTNTLKDQFTILPSERHISSSQQNLSLQHKLLSKKQRQQLYDLPQQINSVKKHKPHRVITSVANSNIIPYASLTTHSATEGNSYLNSANTKKFLGSTQKPIRPKISYAPSLATSAQNINNSFSMISQLQQQSHLEIIPQSNIRSETENVFKRSFSEQNQSELLSFVKTDSTLVFELPKQTVTIPSSGAVKLKNQDKSKDNKVEIITLDD